MFILNILGQVAVVILIALLLARRECSLLLPPAVDCLEAATTAWAIEQHGVSWRLIIYAQRGSSHADLATTFQKGMSSGLISSSG